MVVDRLKMIECEKHGASLINYFLIEKHVRLLEMTCLFSQSQNLNSWRFLNINFSRVTFRLYSAFSKIALSEVQPSVLPARIWRAFPLSAFIPCVYSRACTALWPSRIIIRAFLSGNGRGQSVLFSSFCEAVDSPRAFHNF